jgi:hypothetical protein
MVKIVILICQLTAQGPCTEDSAMAAALADRQDDGTSCQGLAHMLMNPEFTAKYKTVIACVKDGKPFY